MGGFISHQVKHSRTQQGSTFYDGMVGCKKELGVEVRFLIVKKSIFTFQYLSNHRLTFNTIYF